MKTCNYKFPCHPQDMVDNTPDTVTATSRMLRIQIINMIVELSQKYKQNKIDKKLFVDIDDNNRIIGLDLSKILNIDIDLVVGKRLSIGKLTKDDWTNMKIMK